LEAPETKVYFLLIISFVLYSFRTIPI